MKKILLIFVFLLATSIYSKAQSVNWYKVHDQNLKIIVSDLIVTPDSGIVISMVNGGYFNFNSATSSIIVKYDYFGNKKWEKEFDDFAITDLSVVNNHIIGSAYNILVPDIIGYYDSLKIFKLDMHGNEIVNKNIITAYNSCCRFAMHYLNENGTLNLYTYNKVWNLNANFDTISTYSIKNFEMLNKIEINKGKTFVYGFARVSTVNSEWNFNKTINFNEWVNNFYLTNDTIYAVTNQNIIRIDTNLNILDTINFMSTYAEMFKIERQNNSLLLFGYNQNDQLLIKQCNLQFGLIKEFLIDNPFIVNPIGEHRFNSIAVGQNTFYLTSETNKMCLLTSISQESPIINIENIDISIEDVSLSIDSVSYLSNHCGGTSISGVYFSTEIVIKNNSNNSVNNFKLFSINNQSNQFFSGPQILIDQVINRTIAPNDTIVFKLNNKYAEIYLSTYFEFCVEASLPNGLLDPSFEDNKMCKTETGLGLEENAKLNFSIFPSPAKDYLHIEFKNNLQNQSTIEIINVLGTTVEKVNVYGNTNKIDVSKLNEGIYLIRIINNGKLLGTKKFVKQ